MPFKLLVELTSVNNALWKPGSGHRWTMKGDDTKEKENTVRSREWQGRKIPTGPHTKMYFILFYIIFIYILYIYVYIIYVIFYE